MVVDPYTPAPISHRRRRLAWLRARWPKRLAVLALVTSLVLVLAGALFYASLPSVADAPARVAAIDARAGTHPVLISRDAKIARAIVAVEDERFYEHGAIDLFSVGRVVRTSLTGSADPGGSTISQQLAKVLYVAQPETFAGRLRAIGLAMKLERRYSKVEILNMYLNSIYFGHGFYGIAAASLGYFGKPVDELSWGQAALLAGLPQSPSAFDPLRHRGRARTRQHEVLAQLVDNRALTSATATAIARARLHLVRRTAS